MKNLKIKVMNKYLLICFGIILFVTTGMAQTTVTGTVSDRYGSMTGTAVLVKGTTTGTITDVSGNFSIQVADPQKAVLLFRFIGMNDVELALEGRVSGINVEMSESASQLEDLVVVGYGVQKRGNLTGAVASVSGKILDRIPAPSVGEAMVGKLPGVQITSMDGSPDAEITIRVRGGGSLTEDNSPLILVDGFEVASINDISANDVESVEVLKDAASTSIYGSRGANGVILITSKRPTEGRVNVNMNAYMQMKTLANRLNVMDPYEFVVMQYETATPKGAGPREGITNKYGQPYEFYIYQGDKGIDWQDEIFGTNPIAQFYDLNINGGTKQTKYKFSIMHQDQPGVMYGNGMKQTNINISVNTKIFDKLTLDYKTRFINKVVDGNGTESVSLLTALRTAPTEGLDDYMTTPEDNSYFDPDDLTTVTRFNPKQEAALNYRKRTTRSFHTMGGLSWDVFNNLLLRSEFGYEHRNTEDRRFWGLETRTAQNNNNQPVARMVQGQSPSWQWTNTANYNPTLSDDHSLSIMLGHEMKSREDISFTNNYRYFPENIIAEKVFDNLTLGTAYEPSSDNRTPVRTLSFFGRINYSYKDRYLATLTTRTDGSTKFKEGNRWGVFPAFAAAWRISNEDFLVDSRTISNLKLRLSYGLAGNDRIPSDLYSQFYGVGRSRSAGWNEEERYYYRFYKTDNLSNSAIKWETTTTRNLGIDFGFFRERLNGNLDIYWNTTKDLLVPTDIPGHTGYTKMTTNAGQTSNKGIELALNGYIIEKKDFTLSANFNAAYNRNRIDKLSSGETEWILFSNWAGTQLVNTDDYRAYVGSQKGLIYGYVNDGFYTMDDFSTFDAVNRKWILKDGVTNSYNITGDPMPGTPKFKKLTDTDPNDPNTHYISDADREVIGNTNPKLSGGFGLDATWKGFDCMLFFNYVYGFDVYNANKIVLTSNYDNSSYRQNFGMEVSMQNRWRYTDDMGNDMRYSPEALAMLNRNATMWSPISLTRPVAMSYGVEDGSFLRLNTASVGYTLPEHITTKYGVKRLRVYATGYNLFTITAYSGYDPEVNIDRGLTPAIDYNAYPRSRTYTLGVQLTF